MFRTKLFTIITLFALMLSCDGKTTDKDKTMKNKNEKQNKLTPPPPKINHEFNAGEKDLTLSLKVPAKATLEHYIDRLNKKIVLSFPDHLLSDGESDVKKGLIIGISTKKAGEGSELSITLKRPLRYEINRDEEGKVLVTLKNYKELSSLSPVNRDIIDFHNKTITIDLHNDLLFKLYTRKLHVTNDDPDLESSLDNMFNGGVSAAFFSVWVPDYFLGGRRKLHYNNPVLKNFKEFRGKPFDLTEELVDKMKDEVDLEPRLNLAMSSADIVTNWKNNKKSALMGLEGAHSLGQDVFRVKMLYRLGVRYVGITWSNSNLFASAAGDDKRGGLTPLGEDLVKAMMNVGMMIDVSHLSDRAFADLVKLTKHEYPIVATHSTSRVLRKHKRNLTDEMIEDIRKSQGFIGVVFHSDFLVKGRRATIEDVLDHIDYIVAKAGIDTVSLGSDFDGFIKTPTGLEDMSAMPNISLGLYNRGYSREDIEKVLGQNVLRVMRLVESKRNEDF